MRQPPPLYEISHCLRLPHCVKTCLHAKKNLNFIINRKFTLNLNKGLSELITCWEINYSQEVLILENSTEEIKNITLIQAPIHFSERFMWYGTRWQKEYFFKINLSRVYGKFGGKRDLRHDNL